MSNNTNSSTSPSSIEGLRALEEVLVEVLGLIDQADRRLVEGWQGLAPADPLEGRIEGLMGAIFAPVQEAEGLLEEVRARMS